MPITAGYVWRPYVKPSLKGALVLRVRTVRRQSQNVIEINRQLEEAAASGKAPATLAKEECLRHPEWTYVDRYGVRHCKWDKFIVLLRKYMRQTIRPVRSAGVSVSRASTVGGRAMV